jgi:peptidoglycan/xylan/chitin deacetylase (PgdA/CDA1 family)
MERGNHLLLRLIVSFEIAILYTLIFLLSNHNKEIIIENPTTYQEDIDNLEKEIVFYNNIEEETNKLYEEYTDNINKLENMIVKKETKAKIAYLTFDDGPYDQTQKYLDVLKKNNVRATFFTLGKQDYKDTYIRIVNEDHTLANHTYYHSIHNGLYKSSDNFMNQVQKLEDLIYSYTGHKTNIVRFPGGSATAGKYKNEIINKLHNKGYKYVDWNCYTGDGSNDLMAKHDAYYYYQDTCKDDILVILMHDYNYSTLNNLEKIINDLKDRGYILLPLTNKSIMVK